MSDLKTLRSIITDLLNIIRGSELVRTEPISMMQLETWVNQYRMLLLKRELDKRRFINPDYVQVITDILMESSNGIYRTSMDMPSTITRNYDSGFTWIGDANGNEYQYQTEQRSNWQSFRKYTSDDDYVYLRGRRLYTNNSSDLIVKGIFENPIEAASINDPSVGYDMLYPIPAHLIPTLKEMILKGELGIEAESPNDDTNDGTHNIN